MRAIRIYSLIWLLVLGVTGLSYSTGLINTVTFPIFGLVVGTLVAAGFVAVLPIWLTVHHSPRTYPIVRKR